MKKLILAAIAATMISGGAHACDLSKFGPQNVFNKVELTDKDKCWLDNHAVKNYGIDGNIFWVKALGKYYSAPISHIRDLGTKEWLNEHVKGSILADIEKSEEASIEIAKLETIKETIEDKAVLDVIEDRITTLTVDVVVEGIGSDDIAAYGLDAIGIYDEDSFSSINELIETAVSNAFDSGYEAGYADGYADGFADGVASVK